jgi:hypothetical protein
MTLIEMLIVLAFLGLGIGGFLAGLPDGPLAGVLGALAGVLVLPALALVVVQIEQTLTGRPQWPACRDCAHDGYSFEWAHGHCVARCACGAGYVRRGRQCLRLLPGGATRPHMRWRPLWGWVREGGPGAEDPRTPYRDDHESAR